MFWELNSRHRRHHHIKQHLLGTYHMLGVCSSRQTLYRILPPPPSILLTPILQMGKSMFSEGRPQLAKGRAGWSLRTRQSSLGSGPVALKSSGLHMRQNQVQTLAPPLSKWWMSSGHVKWPLGASVSSPCKMGP